MLFVLLQFSFCLTCVVMTLKTFPLSTLHHFAVFMTNTVQAGTTVSHSYKGCQTKNSLSGEYLTTSVKSLRFQQNTRHFTEDVMR